MSAAWPALPVFVRVAGRAVVLVGEGEAADAKRRLLERAGAVVVGEDRLPPFGSSDVENLFHDQRVSTALDTNDEGRSPMLAIVVDDEAAAARLKARGLLVNVVDRSELCDFTLPAIVDRAPVLVAIGTGGVSAGLAAALRQRLETILPATLGALAEALQAARGELRRLFPDKDVRRRAIGRALSAGGDLDPFGPDPDVNFWLGADELRDAVTRELVVIHLTSTDPDDLTLRQARWLAQADRVTHRADVPAVILDRARADAVRVATGAPLDDDAAGLTVDVAMV